MPDNLDMDKVNAMSLEDIENLRVEKMKELSRFSEALGLIEQAYLDLQLKIITLQGEKKEIEIRFRKGKQVVRQSILQLKMIENSFWRKKN